MRKYIFMLMAMISQPSVASNAGPGKVVIPIVDRAGKFFFNHTGSRGARPACGFYDRWAVDVNIPKGQFMMSLILTAYSQGKNISVVGSNECGDAGDTEGIAYVMAND